MILDDCYSGFVNLDSRPDRLSHMEGQLAKINLKAVRHRGILPHEIDNPRCEVMRRRTPGAIGCHFAQLGVIQTAKEEGKHAFVMEDDLIFCSDFQERMEYITKFLENTDWDIMWLGGTFHINPPFWHKFGQSGMPPSCSAQLGYDAEVTKDNRILRTYGAFCTYAYIVNHRSIDRVLGLLDKHLHESIGIDWLMIKIQPQLNTFAFIPGSVKQMDNMSNIGTGMTMFSGFANLGKYWWADKMNEFNPEELVWAS